MIILDRIILKHYNNLISTRYTITRVNYYMYKGMETFNYIKQTRKQSQT
jgi:hypothetical protein